jgi:hypothetical protein
VHTSQETLWEPKWELCCFILTRPTAQTSAPSGFHLFCSLTEHIDGKHFSGDAEAEHDVQTSLMEQTTAALQTILLGVVQTQLL